MSELYPVLILKGLGWLLMARFTPHSRADVAQLWPKELTNWLEGSRRTAALTGAIFSRLTLAYFNVTEHPTAAWVAQQLREAFPGMVRRDT